MTQWILQVDDWNEGVIIDDNNKMINLDESIGIFQKIFMPNWMLTSYLETTPLMQFMNVSFWLLQVNLVPRFEIVENLFGFLPIVTRSVFRKSIWPLYQDSSHGLIGFIEYSIM